jgi:hypothetical protein
MEEKKELVAETVKAVKGKKWTKRLLIGGGILVVGLVGALILGSKKDNSAPEIVDEVPANETEENSNVIEFNQNNE